MTPLVHFIGAGPGDPGLLTIHGQALIAQADLVLYAGSLVPAAVVAHAKPGAQVVDSAPLNLEETHALILDTVRRGGTVARVHTGDPSLYGAVGEQIALLERDHIPFAIIPGVTAAFAAAARAQISFTVPEETQTLIITRLHGRTPTPERERLRELARHGSSVAVYLSADKADTLADELRQAGLPPDTTIVVGHKVGHPDENILRTTLAELEKSVTAARIRRQAVFLILPGKRNTEHVSRLYAPDFGHGFRPPIRPQSWPRLAIYALTSQGLDLARRIASQQLADIFTPTRLAGPDTHAFERISDQVQNIFTQYHAHVFITATGIAVRTIAPLLHDKTTDPAVLVCDQSGEHIISLLGGHLGGANDLTLRLARHINARPVITTATDTAKRPAIDILAQQHRCAIADPSRIVVVNSQLAEGHTVRVHDPENHLCLGDEDAFFELVSDAQTADVVVTWKATGHPGLVLHPRCLCLGIGCRRHVPAQKILAAITEVMTENALAWASLGILASIDLKMDEAGLLDAATTLNLPLTFFTRSVLDQTPVPNPSALVRKKTGAQSVCEAASLQGAWKTNPQARLIIPKTIKGSVTVAVAG